MPNSQFSASKKKQPRSSDESELVGKLIEVLGESHFDTITTWQEKNGVVAFRCTTPSNVQYQGVDTAQGLVIRASDGSVYYTTSTSGAEAGKQALETYFHEVFRFVKGQLKGDVNYKYYTAKSGQYLIVTQKDESQRTVGKIILPGGMIMKFTGDEHYIEIDEG